MALANAAFDSRARIAAASAAVALAFVGVLMLAGVWNLPPPALWAFAFVRRLPVALRLSMAMAVVLSGVVLTFVRFEKIGARPGSSTIARETVPAVLLAGILFWVFREHTHYGDAVQKLQLLSTRTVQTDPFVWKEPLDSLVTYEFVRLLRVWRLEPGVAVAVLSVLSGMLYVSAAIRIARLLGARGSQQLFYLVGLLAIGTTQLWFGHVENYSLVTAAALAAQAQAIGFLLGAAKLWSVGLASGLAVSLHPQAAFLMPALLLLIDRRRWRSQCLELFASGVMAPALTVAVLKGLGVPWPSVTGGFAGDPKLFLGISEIIRTSHLWDATNNLLLVAPLAPLWIGVGIWMWFRDADDRVLEYLAAAAAGLLVYHFSFQNDLPRQQDWDLFAIVGPGLTLWGLHAWRRLFDMRPLSKPPSRWRHTMWPALTFASVFAIAWVALNHMRPS